jgi:hypothetical protein
MEQQFAAFTSQHNTAYQPTHTAQPPPIAQFSIPNFATFSTNGCGGGRRGGRGKGGCSNFATTGRRNVHTPFANVLKCSGQGRLPSIGGSGGRNGGVAPFVQQSTAQNLPPMYSNIIKRYAN